MCYNTFYVRNLLIFFGRPFQPTIMFVSKASNSKVAHLKGAALEYAPALLPKLHKAGKARQEWTF
jgi:hypothetical protein